MVRFFQILERIVNVLSAVLVAFLTVVVSTEVISRYFFGFPITITTELTTIAFPWIVALAAITITINDENLALLFVKDSFKGRKRFVIEIILRTLSLVFSVIMTKASFELNVLLSSQRMALLQFSKVVLYSSVFVSFAFMSLILAYKLYSLFAHEREVYR